MTTRRRLTMVVRALSACLALAGPTTSLAQAADDPLGPFAVRREFAVAMKARDGTTLMADVYRPVTPERVPVILLRTPYMRTLLAYYREGHYWASHGYAYVVQDVRGRGESEGTFEPLVNEGRDGSDAQSWAATRPWSNGRVGTIGGSYAGWTQLLTAPLANPAVRAMIPMVTPPDPGYYWPMRNGAPTFGQVEWLMGVAGRIGRDLPDGEAEYLPEYKTPPLETVDVRMGRRLETWQRYLANLDNAAFWEPRSYQARLPRSPHPMLHVTGWYDGTLGGSLQNFPAMRARGTPAARDRQYLIVGPWRHWVDADSRSRTVGGVDFGDASVVSMHRQYRAWFDRWLRDDATAIDAWPRVRLFAMGANRWLAADDWPIPGTRFVPFYLQGGVAGTPSAGTLSTDAPADGVDHYTYDPGDPTPFIWSRNVDSGGPDDYREVERRADVLVYTMPVPASPLTVCGPVTATIVATSDARDTDWLARLSLVRADGTSQRLTEGWRRARTRRGEFRNDPLVPGRAESYALDLWGTCVSLGSGETLRLAVTSAAFPLVTPNLNTGGAIGSERTPRVAHQVIHHERGRLSSVTLPIVDAPRWVTRP